MMTNQQTYRRLTFILTFISMMALNWTLATDLAVASTFARLESCATNQIVATDPLFKAWAEQIPPPRYAEYARKLAAHLTWGNIQEIKLFGGIAYLTLNAGCAHKCIGCSMGCDLDSGAIRAMTWENFQELVYRLAGLQNAMDAIFGHDEILLLNPNWIGPYYESDPMGTILYDRLGVAHHIAEIAAFFKKITGRAMDIWTSGWPSKSKILQKGAEALVLAQFAGNGTMDEFRLEIKTFTIPFLENLKKIIPSLLLGNSLFQQKFATDFARWGLEIDNYSNPPAAWAIYNQLVHDHFKEILDQSKYFQERLANIKTLRALFQAAASHKINIGVRIYFLAQNNLSLGHEIPRLAFPFLDRHKMRVYVKDKVGHFVADHLIISEYWNFSQRTVLAQGDNFRSLVVGVGGDLKLLDPFSMFSSSKFQGPSSMSNLTHRPIFFELSHAPWQEVASRITLVNGRDLSRVERDSIGQQILATGTLPATTTLDDLFVSETVEIEKAVNGKFRAFVIVLFNHKNYQFDFSSGKILPDLAPTTKIFPLTEQVLLQVPSPHNLSPATEKLIFGFA